MPAATPARISTAVLSAVDAARAGNADDFAEAVSDVNALDQSRLTLVLAGIIRSVLEILHPDGLDGDDVQDALTDTAKQNSWYPGLQPEAVGEVLLGALGVLAPEDVKTASAFNAHAALVISTLSSKQPVPLSRLVERELAEIRRAETMEMP